MTIASIQDDRRHEIDAERQKQLQFGPRPSARSILLTLTVVLLGMLAWWGH